MTRDKITIILELIDLIFLILLHQLFLLNTILTYFPGPGQMWV